MALIKRDMAYIALLSTGDYNMTRYREESNKTDALLLRYFNEYMDYELDCLECQVYPMTEFNDFYYDADALDVAKDVLRGYRYSNDTEDKFNAYDDFFTIDSDTGYLMSIPTAEDALEIMKYRIDDMEKFLAWCEEEETYTV